MTTYSTQNPIGSSDPRDLYDNAENLDNFVNGDQAAYNDRLGKSRRSWQSVEDQVNQQEAEFNTAQSYRADAFQAAQDDREGVFNAYLVSAGYQFAGDYAAGIEITQYNQVVRDTSGEFWRASGSTALPYTTTGAGLPEGGAFVAVGDAVLRQELSGDPASGQGAALVKGAPITRATVAEIEALQAPVGTVVYLTQKGRAGEFTVKAGTPPSDPQKGIYITLANGNYAERVFSGPVDVKWFGAFGNDSADESVAFQAAFDASTDIYLSPGTYRIYETLRLPNSISIEAHNSNFDVYTAIGMEALIKTYSKSVFVPKNPANSTLSIRLSGTFFRNMTPVDPAGDDAILFNDFSFYGVSIRQNTIALYGTVFVGRIARVSYIANNAFYGIRRYLLDGPAGRYSSKRGGSIMDSVITGNYINGDPNTNATAFQVAETSLSVISENYFDFLKRGIFIDYSTGLRVSGNVFDYIFRAISSMTEGVTGMNDVSISGNRFYNIAKSRAAQYFGALDSEMDSDQWVAVYQVMRDSLVVDNVAVDCELFVKSRGRSKNLTVRSNNVKTAFTADTIYADIGVMYSADAGTMDGIYIEGLDFMAVDALPVATPSSTIARETFRGQHVLYRGGTFKNVNDKWELVRGTVAEDVADANYSYSPASGVTLLRFATDLTASRNISIGSTGAYEGCRLKVVRSGLGAGQLAVGGLKTMPAGVSAWAEIEYLGGSWRLTGYGEL